MDWSKWPNVAMGIPNAGSLSEIQEVAKACKLALVHFWASWCEPCQQMDQVLVELAQRHQGLLCIRVEAEVVDEASLHFNIAMAPTVVLLQGTKEVGRVEGADPAALVAAVAAALGSAAQPSRAPAVPASLPTPIAPAAAATAPQQDIEARIKTLLASQPVILFMKGTVDAPRCGFSSRVVKVLQSLQAPIHGVDILEDEALRSGLKDYSNWPTYPQLYIGGELVGGCDIVEEMQASGELKQLLASKLSGLPGPTPAPPAAAHAPAPVAAPQSATQAANGNSPEDLTARLQALVQQQPVMLFMKGSPAEPRCGFSRKVAAALQANNVPFGHFDILTDEAVRAGLKEYSNWPTFPQLYVAGELLGGCDIVLEMQEAGELGSTIQSMTAQKMVA